MKKQHLLGYLLSFLTLAAFTQENPTVQIVNSTGYTVYNIFISQTASDDWLDDVMGDKILNDGQYFTARLQYPLNVTNHYDIKLVDEDGDTYTKWDVLITPDSRIEFTISDLDAANTTTTEGTDPDRPIVSIVNNTGYTVYYVYISQTATDDWEEDVLGDETLSNGEYIDVTLLYPLNVVNRYDIKLVDEDGDSYTKWDVLISSDSVIEFTFDDYDE